MHFFCVYTYCSCVFVHFLGWFSLPTFCAYIYTLSTSHCTCIHFVQCVCPFSVSFRACVCTYTLYRRYGYYFLIGLFFSSSLPCDFWMFFVSCLDSFFCLGISLFKCFSLSLPHTCCPNGLPVLGGEEFIVLVLVSKVTLRLNWQALGWFQGVVSGVGCDFSIQPISWHSQNRASTLSHILNEKHAIAGKKKKKNAMCIHLTSHYPASLSPQKMSFFFFPSNF